MRMLERLFCGFVCAAWVGLFVHPDGTACEWRPSSQGGSGEACRSLERDPTVLPGW